MVLGSRAVTAATVRFAAKTLLALVKECPTGDRPRDTSGSLSQLRSAWDLQQKSSKLIMQHTWTNRPVRPTHVPADSVLLWKYLYFSIANTTYFAEVTHRKKLWRKSWKKKEYITWYPIIKRNYFIFDDKMCGQNSWLETGAPTFSTFSN